MSWFWLVSVWVLAIVFVLGVCLSLFGMFLEGLVAVAIAAFAAVGLFAYWLEKRPKREANDGDPDLTETKVWRPYRTASARFNRRFLSHLAAIESELQRAATDEGWSINWEAHESAYRSAKQALDRREYTQAFADFAKVIDILMVGLHLFRKQASREAKWGRSAPPSPAAKTKP